MLLTKKTVITLDKNFFQDVNLRMNAIVFKNTVDLKIKEMVIANKTDGVINFITEDIIERYWIDEAAAQEYLNTIFVAAAQENILFDAVIKDNM